MSANKVLYPGPGCLVEFMQGNSPMQAVVLEVQGDKVRVYALNRRESKLATSRLLPWSGPALGAGKLSRQSMDEALEERRALRASIAGGISALEVWELTQGEMPRANAGWLAGLIWEQPTIDQEAALGHALLAAKTHFRFSPPDFDIFSEETVALREAEAQSVRLREVFAITGAQFFQKLYDIAQKKRGPLDAADAPDAELAATLKSMLLARIADPDEDSDAPLWKLLTKGLPESPHQALVLATAWGLVPEHYNFYLDRIDYEREDSWVAPFTDECDALTAMVREATAGLPQESACHISIDPAQTQDRDDAFAVRREAHGGYTVSIALACPALAWPFGSALDKAVLHRASSLYLPEGDLHMLPQQIGRGLFSLDAGVLRPSLLVRLSVSPEGEVLHKEPVICALAGTRNMDLESAEAAIAKAEAGTPEDAENMLGQALELARLLQARRIAAGAVITERPDPDIVAEQTNGEWQVSIDKGPDAARAHLVVGEMMILANGALASWAMEHGVPLLFRCQDVALPKEFAGIWTEPQDISRVVRALPPAALDSQPRRHAGLGLAAYTSATSPIRRYTDLLNQGQIVSFLRNGAPRLTQEQLSALLPFLSARADAVGQVQRLRPRYWKLHFFRSHGDRAWWDAVVTDENDAFATFALPWAHLLVRGKRRRFDEKLFPGMAVQVRLGKIDPLQGEIQVIEAQES